MATFRSGIPVVLLAIFASGSMPASAGQQNPEANAQKGAVLFHDKGCDHCHGIGGIGGLKGPSLVDIRNDKAWPPEKMTDQLLDGGQKMPPFRDSLTDEEIAQLIAYLRAKNRPAPPPLPLSLPDACTVPAPPSQTN